MSESHTFTTVTDDRRVASNVSEEGLNQFTHGIGFGLSLIATVHLLSQTFTSQLVFAGCCVYCVSFVALYGASTLSHSFDDDARKNRFRTLDQICIFLFMAGIFTPVSLCVCDGWWHVPLVMMWLTAIVGVYLKLRVTKKDMVPVWFYILLGAIPLVAFPQILAGVGSRGMMWILAAAACYLVGILFFVNDHRHRFFHPVWHVLVMMGSACHYVTILHYVAG